MRSETPPEKIPEHLDPALVEDLDEDGNLDVEWYPLPDWLSGDDEDVEPVE